MASAAGKKNPLTTTVNTAMAPSYWVSNMGRNIIGIAGATCAGVYFSGHAILHAFLLDRYQKVVQLYKNGFPTPLPPEVKERCQQTVADMNIKLKNEDMARFFCVFGMDMFHAGSTKLRGGSIIGVPYHFSYKTPHDIEKNDIMVENNPIEWGSDGGRMLQDSLILSERAQKFAIARDVAMVDSHIPYINGGIGSGVIGTYCLTTRLLNDKLYGLARPRSFRVMMYSFVGTFAYGLWTTVTDLVTKYYENRADSAAGKISIEYAKGGVEFYSKIIQRNMALRSLMGPAGEKRFTFYGNDSELIRQKHVPFSERKINLENIATEISKLSNKSYVQEEANLTA